MLPFVAVRHMVKLLVNGAKSFTAVLERAVENRPENAVFDVGMVIPERCVAVVATLAEPSVLDYFVRSGMLGIRQRNTAMFAESLFDGPQPNVLTFRGKRAVGGAACGGEDLSNDLLPLFIVI